MATWQDLAIMVVVISVMIGGMGAFITSLDEVYAPDENLSQIDYSKFDFMSNITKDISTPMEEDVKGAGGELDADTEEYEGLISAGWKGFKTIYAIPGALKIMVQEGYNLVNFILPPIAKNALIALIAIVTIFGLLYAWAKIRF